MSAVSFQKQDNPKYNKMMGYIADYIQNEYHLLFASKKWIYISVNCENEEKIPYEDLIIQAVLF